MTGAVDPNEVGTALETGSHELISLVGGGGKTTLLFALGAQLDGSVLMTCTTKMETGVADDRTLRSPSDDDLRNALAERSPVLAVDGAVEGKLRGIPPETVDRWFDLADHVVVEADGSRGRPCTAPAAHEPPIPSRSTLVVAVIGADALGRVIADRCHRPLRVAALADCSPYQRLTAGRATAVIASERGLRKNVPATARFVAAITKVDERSVEATTELAARLRHRGIAVVLIASTRP